MSSTQELMSQKPLRLWPGVLAAVIVVIMRFIVPLAFPDATTTGVLVAMAGAIVIILWWLFFSRAAWLDRIGALLLIVVATVLTRLVVHPSIAGGFMGNMMYVYALPATVLPALVAWAVATRRRSAPFRRATLVITVLLATGVWTLLRTDGVKGEAGAQLKWRWTPTAEERLLAQEGVGAVPSPRPEPTESPSGGKEPSAIATPPLPPGRTDEAAPAAKKKETPVAAPPAAAKAIIPESKPTAAAEVSDPVVARVSWPGFRGPNRDSVIRGVRIKTDWSNSPPVEVWRHPVGPGWSSFAVAGDLIYTQEQRGEQEMVSCYRLSTGEPVWRHSDRVRFYESNGGAGPRGTPTVHAGRVYTLGATGIANALDARTGAVVWTRNAAADTGARLPGWGFTSSPIVVDDAVIVSTSGRLVAYDVATGTPRWTRQTAGGGYSSPHLATLDGVTQVLLLSGGGATSVAPKDGTVLWQHPFKEMINIVQPAVADDGTVLISASDAMGGQGMRRLSVARASDGWTAQERWTSRGLKPYFNDFVVHEGHAFGFDGTILACINLEDGERKWKGGRYGAGQMVLLPDQDLLLVLSEDGELALVSATPDKHSELARFKAIEGKTWNHPVLVGDMLLVRNGEEMAAFRIQREGR